MLSGLTRVRQFSQDDAHCFVMEEQIADGGRAAAEAGAARLRRLRPASTRPSSRPGRRSSSARSRPGTTPRRSLKQALDAAGQPYTINAGDGAFYGPKIDFDITDAIGRKWQCATIQLDYQMPERFELKYVGADNAEHRPVVIHRAIFGSFERFIAILIEHYAGAFPLWLAPVQAIGAADRRPASRVRGGRCRRGWRRPGCGSRSTSARRRLDIRSARPSCRRFPTCWWSATGRRPRGPWRSGTGRSGDLGSRTVEDFVAQALEEVRTRRRADRDQAEAEAAELLDEAAWRCAGG